MSAYDLKDWPDLLERIRRKPGMYIGQPSLSALYHLIGGFRFAEDVHNIPATQRLGGFAWDQFEAWANERFNPKKLSIRSFGMAIRMTRSEPEAFALWFEWYDQFNRDHNSDQ